METLDEHKEDDGDEDEGKQSTLKLFFIAAEDEDMSSCTPKSLTPPATAALWVVQVLELWPIFQQWEHFLPIFTQTELNFLDKQPPNTHE